MAELIDSTGHHTSVDRSLISRVQAQVEEGLERSGLYIYVVDRDCRFQYISSSAARSLGREPGEVVGRTPIELGMPTDVCGEIEAIIQRTMVTGETVRGSLAVNIKGAENFEYDVTPIFNGGPEPTSFLALVFDRTAQANEKNVLEAIGRVNDSVRLAQEPSKLVKRAIDAVAGSLNNDALALVINNGGDWTASHSLKLPLEEDEALGREVIHMVRGFMDQTGPVTIDDASKDPRIFEEVVARYGGGSILIIPAKIRPNARMAIIFIRMNVSPFTSYEIGLGEKIASSVSVAIKDQLMLQELTKADTDRKMMVTHLAKESEKLTRILDATPVAIALFEADEKDFRLVLCNSVFRDRVLITVPRPLEGRPLSELATTEELSIGRKMVRDAFKSGKTQVTQEYMHFTGEIAFPSQVMITPLSKDPEAFLLVAVNITEIVNARKQLEEYAASVEAERARLRVIIDNLPVGVLLVDAAGNILEANDKRTDIWGNKLAKERTLDFVRSAKAKWSNNGMPVHKGEWPISRALKNGEYIKGEMIDIVRSDGRQGTELVSAAPIHDGKGKRIGAVGIMQDVTDQRQLEHEALEAKERAEMYLDLLTHDIQGHNAAISGYIQLAIAKDKQGKKKDELQKALDSIAASSDLIDMMRKIQMVEMNDGAHGHLELSSMLDEVISDVQVVGGERIHIEKTAIPDSYTLASPMIREAFWNILINSVKHSEGDVRIVVRQNRSYDGGREYHKIIIEDDGPGIPDDIKPKVFLRKYRGRTKAHGSGLGLYLTKRLVEENGGRIWLEDRIPGDHARGARFIVHLPTVAMPMESTSVERGKR